MELSPQLFMELAYALGIGLLLGLERTLGPSGSEGETDAAADGGDETETEAAAEGGDETEAEPAGDPGEALGVRTFALLSLVGYGAALLGGTYPFVPPVVLAAVAVVVVVMYRRATWLGVGITTEVAAIGACVLGMLCRTNPQMAGVIALVVTVLLASKRFTYGVIRRMRWVELTDTLKFLVIIVIVLPLLPNRALDPYGAFNPYKVGLLVVLISGIGFVGYFLTRILGAKRGLGLTGILGGLTSSTAVTVAMAQEAKANPAVRRVCAFATVSANATMFVRVLVVVAVLAPKLVMRLAWSVGGMAVAAALCSVYLWLRAGKGEEAQAEQESALQLKNPFSLGPAIKFALFFVVILFVAKLAKAWFGHHGLYAAAGLSGLADVDAITLSIAEQTKAGALSLAVAGLGITIAVVSNSVVKTGIAIYSGGWAFGRIIGICLGIATAVGLTAAVVV